jgi:hypothetical protein
MERRRAVADLQLQSHIIMRPERRATPRVGKQPPGPTQHLVALRSKPSIGRYQPATPRTERGEAASPAAAQSLAGPGLLPDLGEKTARADTMDVAVAMRLGVIELSGMRWRATTLMPLDLHGHGSTLRLRFCSAASAIERSCAWRSRLRPVRNLRSICNAVLECG